MTDRQTEIWERLSRVVDPELDEPVTDLRFVTGVEVAAEGDVRIGFRLPTYWCAANFAYIMADDMRREVASLPWVRDVAVVLDEHMYSEQINHGIAGGHSFRQTFGAEAQEEDVEDVRRIFLVKAFQRRQLALLEVLLAAGHPPAALLGWTMAELERQSATPEAARYEARRDVAGVGGPDRLAFVTPTGLAILPEGLPAHIRALRSVSVNVEFNGSLCRGLLAARYDDEPAAVVEQPGLIDFIRRLPRHRAA